MLNKLRGLPINSFHQTEESEGTFGDSEETAVDQGIQGCGFDKSLNDGCRHVCHWRRRTKFRTERCEQ